MFVLRCHPCGEIKIHMYVLQGGIKAVVWTDAIQMVILLGGLIVIAAIGASKMGGGNAVWEIAKSTGRTNFAE